MNETTWTTHQIITLITALCYPAQQLCPALRVTLAQWTDALNKLAGLLEEVSEGSPDRTWTVAEVRSLIFQRIIGEGGQHSAAMATVLYVLGGGSQEATEEPAGKYDELDRSVWRWEP
jgi:hypothetical protein